MHIYMTRLVAEKMLSGTDVAPRINGLGLDWKSPSGAMLRAPSALITDIRCKKTHVKEKCSTAVLKVG